MKRDYRPAIAKGVAWLIAATILTWWLAAGADDIATPPPVNDTPFAPGTVLHEHDSECWRAGERPLAEIPGSAIVQFRDGTTVRTYRHDLVDEAFAEALAESGYGDRVSDRIDPIAMCL